MVVGAAMLCVCEGWRCLGWNIILWVGSFWYNGTKTRWQLRSFAMATDKCCLKLYGRGNGIVVHFFAKLRCRLVWRWSPVFFLFCLCSFFILLAQRCSTRTYILGSCFERPPTNPTPRTPVFDCCYLPVSAKVSYSGENWFWKIHRNVLLFIKNVSGLNKSRVTILPKWGGHFPVLC